MAAKRTLPTFIEPMLAQTSEPFDSEDHIFEVKWDGTRCLAYIEADRYRLLNRREIEMRARYPEFEVVQNLPADTVIDGEIVVLRNGRPDFNLLQQRDQTQNAKRVQLLARTTPATFMAFDVLYDRGVSVMNKPLIERRLLLAQLVERMQSPFILVPPYIERYGKQFFAQIEKEAMEGIMAKRRGSRYVPGQRSADWLKIKVGASGTFEVLGFTVKERPAMIAALLIGERYRGKLQFKGKVGTGFTEADRAALFEELKDKPPLASPPPDGPAEAQWRDAGWSCRVKYFEKTKTGKLRGPVFLERL